MNLKIPAVDDYYLKDSTKSSPGAAPSAAIGCSDVMYFFHILFSKFQTEIIY